MILKKEFIDKDKANLYNGYVDFVIIVCQIFNIFILFCYS